MSSSRLIAAHLLVAALFAPAAADAQLGRSLASPRAEDASADEVPEPADASDPWAFDLSGTVSYPLGVSVDGQLTTPLGFFARGSVGHVPSPFLGSVADIVSNAGALRDGARPIVDDATANGAWTFGIAAGFQAPQGFELTFGYRLLTSAADLSPEAIEAAVNQRFPPGVDAVPLTMTLHALHGSLGWRFLLGDAVALRVALGWTHAFANDVTLDVPDEVRARDDGATQDLEEAMHDGLSSYGFTPDASVSLGYSFQ